MPNNHDTHVIIHYRDKDTSILARLESEMVICGREKCKVAFGEDPRAQQQRVFLSKDAAISFMKVIADEDQRQIMIHAGHPEDAVYAARICVREGDKKIVSAGVM